ncbi:MAG TPA: efflux RND transporter periplasmic adaptor subunit [Spirochaetota bacterium]|nr:efflux RND transporter periplasmic adaptor subunit [Spirochaetota bacterium]
MNTRDLIQKIRISSIVDAKLRFANAGWPLRGFFLGLRPKSLVKKEKNNKPNLRARITGLVLLGVVTGGIVFSIVVIPELPWKRKKVHADITAADISTMIIESKEVRDTINCLGQIVFREKASISSKVSGRLAKIYVREGQKVKRGEVIAEIERLQYEITLKQQKSELEIAKKALELSEAKHSDAMKGVEIKLKTIKKAEAELRDKKATFENMETILHNKGELYKAGGISKTEYESVKTQHTTLLTNYEVARSDLEIQQVGYRDSDITSSGYKVPDAQSERIKILKIINTKIERAEVESARARLKQVESSLLSTQLMLNETYIRSPLTGVVAVKGMEVGEMVREDSIIATVMDISRVYVSINLGEKEVRRISKGQKISFTVDAYPERKFTAVIEAVTPLLDSKTRTFEVKGISGNSSAELLPGMFSRAVIDTGKTIKGILVPSAALLRGEDGRTEVYLLRNGIVVRENIVTGNESADQVQVLEGLGEGDKIVVNGLNTIYQGMKLNK